MCGELSIVCCVRPLQADADGQNMVDVPKFVRAAAAVIYKLVDLQSQKDKATAIEKMSNTEGAYQLHGMSGDEIKEILQMAFQQADVEQKGYLFPEQVYDVLNMMGTGELGLSGGEINSLLAAVDENDDGVVEWEVGGMPCTREPPLGALCAPYIHRFRAAATLCRALALRTEMAVLCRSLSTSCTTC